MTAVECAESYGYDAAYGASIWPVKKEDWLRSF
jgi:hypothetical protein